MSKHDLLVELIKTILKQDGADMKAGTLFDKWLWIGVFVLWVLWSMTP